MFEYAKKFQEKIMSIGTKEATQLAHLLKMQQVLDEKIFKENGKVEYPEAEINLALITEIGELLQEVPEVFKYWKKTATDDMEKALEEYIDVLHFALSLTNYNAENIVKTGNGIQANGFENVFKVYDYCFACEYSKNCTPAENIHLMILDIINDNVLRLSHVFVLGNYFGFTWDDIYAKYIKKNQVNHKRVEEGY